MSITYDPDDQPLSTELFDSDSDDVVFQPPAIRMSNRNGPGAMNKHDLFATDGEKKRSVQPGGKRSYKKKTRKKKGGTFVRPEDLVEGYQYLYTGPEPHYLPDAELGVNIRITVRYLGRNVPGMTPNQYYFDGERGFHDIFSMGSMNVVNHIRHWPQNPRRGPTFENPNMRYTPTQRRESICENCTIMGGRKRKKSRRKKKTRRKTKKKSKRKKRKSRKRKTKKHKKKKKY